MKNILKNIHSKENASPLILMKNIKTYHIL